MKGENYKATFKITFKLYLYSIDNLYFNLILVNRLIKKYNTVVARFVQKYHFKKNSKFRFHIRASRPCIFKIPEISKN